MIARGVVAGLLTLGLVNAAGAVVVTVPGTSDPWLAGMPPGSTASLGDVAPAQSPAEVTGLPFVAGNLLRFAATGSTDHCTGGACGLAGPEGDAIEGAFGHATGAENGIADLAAPIDALVGVFLDASQPDLSAAPGGLDFSTLVSRDFAILSPLLKQPFFVGDGLRNNGISVQGFVVPAGATRLFLGTMDGYGWANNVGSLSVNVELLSVPEPGMIALFTVACAGLAFSRRRKLRWVERISHDTITKFEKGNRK